MKTRLRKNARLKHYDYSSNGYYFLIALIIFILVALLPNYQITYCADWPTFRGNNQRTGFAREQAYPPLSKVWDFQIQGDVISSPVVYEGVVYIGARSGSVYAINAETGELIWDYSTDDWVDATPAVSSAAVFVPSRDGNLYALDRNTGNILWQKNLGAPSVSSPLYFEGAVYVGMGMPANKIIALNASSGQVLWEYKIDQPLDGAPSSDGNKIYFGANDGRIYALDRNTGVFDWIPSGTQQTKGSFGINAVSVSSGSVYALPGHDEKSLFIFKAEDGNQIIVSDAINISGEAEVTSPVITDKNIYFGMGSSPLTLYAYKRDSLSSVWASSPTLGNTAMVGFLSSPSMANEVIYVGTPDGRLVAVSSSGASVMGDINLSTSCYSSPAISNGMVFIGRNGGRLIAYEAKKVVSISSPYSYEVVDENVEIKGYVRNPNLSGYLLEYGEGENPGSWSTIISSNTSSEIKNGILGIWDTSGVSNGVYTIRLTVNESVAHTSDNTARLTVRVNHPPAPPSNLTASDVPSDSGNKISLSWEASTSPYYTSYRIYRKKESGDFSYLTSVSSSTLSYIDSTAITGTTFTYILRTFDNYVESVNSNESTAYSIDNDPSSDNTMPSAISDLAVIRGKKGGEVELSWTAPGDDGDVGTAAYYAIKYSSFSTDFDLMDVFKSSRVCGGEAGFEESEKIDGLFGGVTYYFAIKTRDSNGNESAVSNIPSQWATFDSTAPAPPSNLQVEDTQGDHGGSLTLTWSLSPDDGTGENDVYGYKIYRRLKMTAYVSSAPYDSVSAGVSKYIDPSANVNVKYYYRVAAFDSSNDSPMSNEAFGISADNWRFLDAANGGAIRLKDGAEVNVPPNGVSQNDNILITKIDTSAFSPSMLKVKSAGANPTGIIYEIKFENPATKLIGKATVKLPYTKEEISGMDEENLRMYTYFEGRWMMFNNSEVLFSEKKVKAITTHFSYFRIMEYIPSGELLVYDKVYTYPNPARGDELTFKFYVADKSYVTIDVYNVAGEKVARLEKPNCPAGIVSEIKWKITNYASGVYIYKVEARSPSGSKKIVKKLAIIH